MLAAVWSRAPVLEITWFKSFLGAWWDVDQNRGVQTPCGLLAMSPPVTMGMALPHRRDSVVKNQSVVPIAGCMELHPRLGRLGLCSQGRLSGEGSWGWTSRQGCVMECRVNVFRKAVRRRPGLGWVARGPSEWSLGVWLLKAALPLPFRLGLVFL